MIFFKIDLEQVREHLGINYSEKKKIKGSEDRCILCGNPIINYDATKTKMVHLTTDGFLVPTNIDVEDSQGLFPVGGNCAKKLNSLMLVAT
jgi:hypothetical protein